jgi:hypothetical protein
MQRYNITMQKQDEKSKGWGQIEKCPAADDQCWHDQPVACARHIGCGCALPGRLRFDRIAYKRLDGRLRLRSHWTAVRVMRWVRAKRRWSTWIALAAMALQLALSFGHIHLENFEQGSVAAAVAASNAPSSDQHPAGHPADHSDDYCAICAAIHLASSSFLPDVPLLPVPVASRVVEHFDHFAFIFVSSQRAAFQSRAPPLF